MPTRQCLPAFTAGTLVPNIDPNDTLASVSFYGMKIDLEQAGPDRTVKQLIEFSMLSLNLYLPTRSISSVIYHGRITLEVYSSASANFPTDVGTCVLRHQAMRTHIAD